MRARGVEYLGTRNVVLAFRGVSRTMPRYVIDSVKIPDNRSVFQLSLKPEKLNFSMSARSAGDICILESSAAVEF